MVDSITVNNQYLLNNSVGHDKITLFHKLEQVFQYFLPPILRQSHMRLIKNLQFCPASQSFGELYTVIGGYIYIMLPIPQSHWQMGWDSLYLESERATAYLPI